MGRFRFLTFFFFLLAFVTVSRLFYWQVLRSKDLKALAESQHWQFLQIPAPRGKIFTSDGFPLVTNQIAYLVYGEPNKIRDREKTAKVLSEVLKIDQASVSARLKDELLFVPIKHKVEGEKVKVLSELNLEGIGQEFEEKRLYPEGSMSAHLLGFVGSDRSGKDTGYFGIEGFYNIELSGQPGILRQEKDAEGQPIIMGEYKATEPLPGYSLSLTIDRAIQFMVENRLKDGVERFGAKSGSVVVMEPGTGKILAMASFPNYEPENWQEYDESLFKNPVICDSYEPGSTFKVVSMAAALDSKAVTPETVCDKCSGPREICGYKISTWNDKYYPNSSMKEILQHSDNVGMVFVIEKLGLKRFFKYLEAFGIGEPTGIDLQEEASPQLRPQNQWYPIDLATAAFGQGISLTPIQMVRAVAVIANGGKLMKPYVIQKIIGEDREIEIRPKVVRQVVSPKTARILTEMLVSAVDNGEARAFKPSGFKIAGKTGTAQIPIAGHYDPHKTIASFVGFAPADEPKFVMLVRLAEPTASPWGSETAAPLFFDIAQDLFAYFGITPGY